MNGNTAIPVFFAIVFSCFTSCKKDRQEQIEVAFHPDFSYTSKETNVNTLVSDSGITRYKLIAQTWLIFGRAKEPYWLFPDGVYCERFDTVFNVEASIKADTAYYYERRKLWKLEGHVDISNFKGERFQTSQMFWDQNKGTIYSDSFIKVTKGEFINEGIGFRSNQDISIYDIFHPTAEIPFEMKRRALGDEAVPADSAQTSPSNLLTEK
ncbi:MAG: LPS export ABC transporter periplasmic protein LptC [Tannerella sp.]|jgi:LPS export ABC transporter protein LptC|nr:LPS export ABC transporter periplasmic protein LptC [Tannerella sp.]